MGSGSPPNHRMLVGVCLPLVFSLSSLLPASAHSHGASAHSHGAHSHSGAGEARPTGFHDPNVVQDAGHIKEHYEGKADIDESKMTPEELEFHYFQLHDFDNNTKLDGLEILAALTHLLPYGDNSTEGQGHSEGHSGGPGGGNSKLQTRCCLITQI